MGVDRSAPTHSGLIMKTEDGGKTFDRQKGLPLLNSMAHFDHESWVVGHNNTIMHSQDDRNWEPQMEKAYRYIDIDFVGTDKGFLLGQSIPVYFPLQDAVILSTDDGGSNWQEMGAHAEWLYCFDFIDSSSGWMGGTKGLYLTEDAGKTMQKVEGAFSDIYSMVFPTRKRGWLAGGNVLWHTSDSGETWQETEADLKSGYMLDIAALGKNAWAAGEQAGMGMEGFVYTTRDDGENFRKTNVEEGLWCISFVTENAGWAGGSETLAAGGGESCLKYRSSVIVTLTSMNSKDRAWWAV